MATAPPSDPDPSGSATPTGPEATLEVGVSGAIADIPAAEWDACATPETADGGRARNPFVSHRFLDALEASGSVRPETGWAPHHLTARLGGRLVGVMPLYLKGHSQGEYVFDHAWANAWERAGGDYYPKLQSAVPFTPVTGPRAMALPEAACGAETVRAALLQGAARLTERHGLSSLHITFCEEPEWALGARLGYLQRTDQQFHWQNHGYETFDAFLAGLASRKRKQLRKERARAVAGGIEIHQLTGAALKPGHWEAFWNFYQDTGYRKWGAPYLTRAFFDLAQERLRDDLLLVLCRRQGRWVAGALNVIGRETLFGRYWGALEDHPCLHFEACYYQAIDYAIAQGMARVEAGAQGGHKLARGYTPVLTRSLHWIPDPGFRRAVSDYLDEERRAVSREAAALAQMSPFRKSG